MLDRRDFIKLCSVAGLTAVSAGLPGTQVLSAAEPLPGKLRKFLLWNMGGGCDMTLVTDPKGDVTNSEGYSVNNPTTSYATSDIRTVGTNLTYPALPATTEPTGANQAFFSTLGQYCTVIRGIDTLTNGHDTGQRTMWSGRMPDNSPAFGALYASAVGQTLPMAFITNGGYDSTAQVPVSKTRLGDANALFPLIYPNRINPDQEDSNLYHTEETFQRIVATRQARLDAMSKTQNLPLIKRAQSLLYTSRLGMQELKKIDEYIDIIEQANGGSLGQGLVRQGHIALAAFKAGLSVCATVNRGGFDDHSNVDQNAPGSIADVLNSMMVVFNTATQVLDMADEILFCLGSEFSRTPRYNDGQGRDHWAVNSILFLDPSGAIPGGRAVGSTNDVLLPEPYDGVMLKPGHVHKWMRQIAGIADNEVVKLFPVDVEEDVDFS